MSTLEQQIWAYKNTPSLTVENPDHIQSLDASGTAAAEATHISALMRNLRPLPVLAGQPLGPVNGRISQTAVKDDEELLKRTAHVRGKKETLMQFYARTGLGAAQILTMIKSEITRFVELATANAMAEPETSIFEPKALPRKMVIADTWADGF